ncbi:flippase [Natrinema hispanicum]|uniref:Membrane protein involved in the export of O-antigen and teichoic acid n=1 Tax=Natrinema hispanicum TaxID=392421 RepID=A0A1I0J5G4_9EURY|nr:flippase [Natrinema hispanicum]SEU04836.1 Membrane protein involved in the export of O-antigen and teichoic acid [Natrinema hispanicum]
MASLLRSIISIFFGKSAGLVIGILFTPILVRLIPQSQYGVYATVLAGFSILTLISKGGLFDATRKVVGDGKDDSQRVSKVVLISLLISVVYALLAGIAVLLSSKLGILPEIYVPYVWAIILVVFFGNVYAVTRAAFYGVQRESIAEALNIGRKLVYTSVALLLAYIGYGVTGVFTGYAFSFVLACILGLLVLRRSITFKMPSKDDVSEYGREIVSFGGYQLIGGLSAMLLYKIDILLVGSYQGQTSAALYQSAIVPAEMIWFVPSVIQAAFLQHTAHLWSNGDIDTINSNLKDGFKYAVLSLSLFGIGLFTLADPFLSVYFGPGYSASSITLQILLIGTFFLGTTRVVTPVLHATGWVRESEAITVVGLCINLVLNVLLIPEYGIIGAGVGTGLSYVAIFAGNALLWQRSPIEIVSLRWIARLLAVQFMFFAVFYMLVSTFSYSPLVSLLVFPPVGLLTFLSLNVAAGYIPVELIREYLHKALLDW